MTADVNGDTSPRLAIIPWLAVIPILRAACVVMVFSVTLHIIGCNGSVFAQTFPSSVDAGRISKQFDMPAKPILILMPPSEEEDSYCHYYCNEDGTEFSADIEKDSPARSRSDVEDEKGIGGAR